MIYNPEKEEEHIDFVIDTIKLDEWGVVGHLDFTKITFSNHIESDLPRMWPNAVSRERAMDGRISYNVTMVRRLSVEDHVLHFIYSGWAI